jgi:tetratricopeptide (TPR) repeat protein
MIRAMDADAPASDFYLAPPLFALIRFGHWDEILKEPLPPAEFHYLTAVWHYARAIALARMGFPDQARSEAKTVHEFVKAVPATLKLGPVNTARQLFELLDAFMTGELEASAGHTEKALAKLTEAVKLEDALGYDEPPPWPQPVRQSLGHEWMVAGKPEEAERVYREDLKQHPENGWSLFGLAEALKAQKSKQTGEVQDRFKKAWSRSDVKLTSSCF